MLGIIRPQRRQNIPAALELQRCVPEPKGSGAQTRTEGGSGTLSVAPERSGTLPVIPERFVGNAVPQDKHPRALEPTLSPCFWEGGASLAFGSAASLDHLSLVCSLLSFTSVSLLKLA